MFARPDPTSKVPSRAMQAVVCLVPVVDLHPAPWNPRAITDERFQNLCRSVAEDPDFLWQRPILAQADGTIYAGNMRYRAAVHLGLVTVPAVLEDVPDRRARERALRDNQQWGQWVAGDLAALLAELGREGSDVDLLGFGERELQQLLDELQLGTVAGDPDDVPPLPTTPVSRLGDLWLLDGHKILCGDARENDDLARLMADERASCLWTDPPYGVSYSGRTPDQLTIPNDDSAGLADLLLRAFRAIDTVLAGGAAIYIAHPAGALSVTYGTRFLEQGWRLHQTLVWVKDTLVLGHSDYQYRHEPILFGYKIAKGRRGRGARGWYGGNDATSVFEVPRPKASRDHPTAKPVALITAMLRNSSRTGEVVLDPFLGSGSTLIACERLGRLGYGIDIDPRYVDLAVHRWEQTTGKTAKLDRGRSTRAAGLVGPARRRNGRRR